MPLVNILCTSRSVITAQPAKVTRVLSSQARRCQSLNQRGQPLAPMWSEQVPILRSGESPGSTRMGIVANVKMMNRVASTHSGGRTSSPGRCSAKTVKPDPQSTSAQPTCTGQKRDCPRCDLVKSPNVQCGPHSSRPFGKFYSVSRSSKDDEAGGRGCIGGWSICVGMRHNAPDGWMMGVPRNPIVAIQ
jgi:hypothetical protein